MATRIQTVYHVSPTVDHPPPVFRSDMDYKARIAWARQLPVLTSLRPAGRPVVVCDSAGMIGGEEAVALGLPVCVFFETADGGEHVIVNEDGTRGAKLPRPAADPDDDGWAVGLVRRDQGYGPGAG